jgi:sporulation protein YlmC with PRC-barrel domain
MVTQVSRWALTTLCGGLLLVGSAMAQQTAPQPTAQRDGAQVAAEKVFRTSTLNGMEVKNQQGESLGKVHELVIDVTTGKVAYAALSHGGVLGIGDKLFAVPFDQFTLKHAEKDTYFLLDMSKEKLAAAPGFDQDKWPDFADANWRQQIDRYYQREQRQAETPTTTTPRR